MSEKTLPAEWVWTTLGRATRINYRDSAIRDLPDDLAVTFLPMAAVDAESGTIAQPEERPLSEVRKGFTPFSEGDVLFAKITPCMENGKAAIAKDLKNKRGFGSTEFHVFSPYTGVLSEWIFYFVRQSSFRRDAKASFTGTAGQLRVPYSFLENYPFPLPPLAEQQRIVAEIEKQLTRLDAGVAALRRAAAKLRRYKAAVLKAACEGRLVPQDPADEPAPLLLRRILAERRQKWEAEQVARGKDPRGLHYEEPALPDTSELPELPAGWCWVRLEQLTGLITSGSRGWAKYYGDEGAVFIRAQDIKTDTLRLASVAHVILPEESAEGTRTRVERDDLLVTITGANVTKTAWVREQMGDAYVSQHVGLVRPILHDSTPYLYYWIVSPFQGRRVLEKSAYGAGKPGLNLDNLRDLIIPIPPLAEQQRIVAEVERRLSVVEELEAALEANLARAGRLRQSILKRAFEGKLVPQDPTDEPAAVLLERIRAERAGRGAEGKGQRATTRTQPRLPHL